MSIGSQDSVNDIEEEKEEKKYEIVEEYNTHISNCFLFDNEKKDDEKKDNENKDNLLETFVFIKFKSYKNTKNYSFCYLCENKIFDVYRIKLFDVFEMSYVNENGNLMSIKTFPNIELFDFSISSVISTILDKNIIYELKIKNLLYECEKTTPQSISLLNLYVDNLSITLENVNVIKKMEKRCERISTLCKSMLNFKIDKSKNWIEIINNNFIKELPIIFKNYHFIIDKIMSDAEKNF